MAEPEERSRAEAPGIAEPEERSRAEAPETAEPPGITEIQSGTRNGLAAAEGKKITSIKRAKLYVKPEEGKAYYVVNEGLKNGSTGAVDL